METIVTSDSTALSEIRIDANTGTPTRTKSTSVGDRVLSPRPASRPTMTKVSTGTRIVPNAPSGSRMKTLISIQVSFSRPRSIRSVADRMAGQLQEHVLQIGDDGSEV